ncbi:MULTISPECIES: siderophore-interacting protein [unclassified Mesorhizobium]|jgi:NADPH-dependent ferric siderophore reductase|uniref:siderophore-interacting protein n=1 Tax=unclassified Mesorhizobium TaxID=325217 RepID=UPI000FCC79CD|nr:MULTISPECIES: siderophore-interacting protein [unclassified Mesorhizobium]RUU64487.1 siderophore-interacting protein [Mesorhizobium sp. M7A.T.Ca.TU.009.01.1.1]RUU84686.1 siderophore-interacting protein [Mesorhizobium sp. M7A.T.Ca.TU.009.01.1.2]RUT89175.1 siderophore-interacting protein [Mesorhizobium sp. M7A.T.Ca.US.000.02.1.1]RUT90181.1 siderophore-interacting protein [Mesorhizobium sp. M7A.T.Ca.US.000.02.2.1]RUU06031.1 siderophore-interacting protein [Mesorhizobium sp. M7A.T.Ca.TU.009.02.
MNEASVRELACEARLNLRRLPDYMDSISDRLRSFEADASHEGKRIDFRFAFGGASFDMERLVMRANAADRDGLARIKDLLATAVQVYAKEENPEIVWTGDLSGETSLAQFREMVVTDIRDLTPHMRRIRLAGENLSRFTKFGGMHIRMLFPTREVPDPLWPVLGGNGLPAWPADDRRPVARVYTIRTLDVETGLIDVDFLIHPGDSVGSAWAMQAAPGMKVGIMGPVGRPVRQAEWYVLGADETGLPALARLLETLPAETKGVAFVEIANDGERQAINNATRIEVHWLTRDGVAAGEDRLLAEAVRSVAWPQGGSAFGWFAAEAAAAKIVREYWRDTLGLGRDQTLAAAYWRRGSAGLMAG